MAYVFEVFFRVFAAAETARLSENIIVCVKVYMCVMSLCSVIVCFLLLMSLMVLS